MTEQHNKQSPYVVGLTGGIGSGKTAASDHFARLGIAVIDADIVARQVVEPGSSALAAIAERFGQPILLADGQLDRAALRQIIFADGEHKHWLEALLHPLIHQRIAQDIEQSTSAYTLLVSPLLFESGQKAFCNRLLLIDVSEDIQIKRTMQRDNNDEALVRAIIASQSSRQQKRAQADDIIDNSGELAALQQQIETLHQQYLQRARQWQQNPH